MRKLITENYLKYGDPTEEIITEERVSQFKKSLEFGNKSDSDLGIPFAQASLL